MAEYEENLEDEGLEDDIDPGQYQTLEVYIRSRLHDRSGVHVPYSVTIWHHRMQTLRTSFSEGMTSRKQQSRLMSPHQSLLQLQMRLKGRSCSLP